MAKDKKKEEKKPLQYNPFSVGGALKLEKERDKEIEKKLKRAMGK